MSHSSIFEDMRNITKNNKKQETNKQTNKINPGQFFSQYRTSNFWMWNRNESTPGHVTKFTAISARVLWNMLSQRQADTTQSWIALESVCNLAHLAMKKKVPPVIRTLFSRIAFKKPVKPHSTLPKEFHSMICLVSFPYMYLFLMACFI
jgi:hypothetical protein